MTPTVINTDTSREVPKASVASSGFSDITYEWTVVTTQSGSLVDLQTAFIGYIHRPAVVIRPSALVPGAWYTFRLSATNTQGGTGFMDHTVRTNAAPIGGFLRVSPASGAELLTEFTVAAQGWIDDVEDLPLRYRFGYEVEGGKQGETDLWSSPRETPTMRGARFRAAGLGTATACWWSGTGWLVWGQPVSSRPHHQSQLWFAIHRAGDPSISI